ncbi:hypothetical protein ABT214_10515 [Micromonospora purpureochromogenes]|uniref:hypothetical protein n=1 Tax=Micromonospora purpureochromogenes TaxID=47872 RepID=UPI00332A6414
MTTWTRRVPWLLAAVPILVLLAACGGVAWLVGGEVAADRACPDRLAADKAEVRTDRGFPAEHLPGLGDFLDVHWQVDTEANPCSRVLGPTDWMYQGVVRLRPADARALAAAYPWEPATAEPAVWPGLSPYVPAGVRWRHSAAYDEGAAGSRHIELHLDPDRAVALFRLWDS